MTRIVWDAEGPVPGGLVRLIARETTLRPFRPDDQRWHGTCPWHPHDSHSLFVTKHVWYCFGCGCGGDAAEWTNRLGRVSSPS